MKLFLSGGGSARKTKELDTEFTNLLDKTKPLLYIPVAMFAEGRTKEECLSWLKSVFCPFIEKYEILDEFEMSNFLLDNIKKYSGIYIGGGNTFYLMKVLIESGFLSVIKYAIDINMPIYGGSAGAIIFSKSIKGSYISDKNNCGLRLFDGLNILNKDLVCHYDKNKEGITELLKNYCHDGFLALDEDVGVIIYGNSARLIGTGNAYFVNKSGEKILTSSELNQMLWCKMKT